MRIQWPPGSSPCRTDNKTRLNSSSHILDSGAFSSLDAPSSCENRLYGSRYYAILPHLPASRLSGGKWSLSATFLSALLYFALFLLLSSSMPLVSAQSVYNGTIVMNGGAGQALVFHGTQSAVTIGLDNLNYILPPSLTLEFWVAPRCTQVACTFFTLKTTNSSEYVQHSKGPEFDPPVCATHTCQISLFNFPFPIFSNNIFTIWR